MISKKLTFFIVGTVLFASLSTAKAEGSYQLSLEQMDGVTAGVFRTRNFNFNFGRTGLVFNNRINEMTETETETGTSITTINLTSLGVRAFAGSIQRIGRFETIFTKTRR